MVDRWLAPSGRALLESDGRLTSWTGTLETLRHDLVSFKSADANDGQDLRLLDLRAESATWTLVLSMRLRARLALSRGLSEEADAWDDLERHLFPHGLAIHKLAHRAQIAETRKILFEARKPEHAPRIALLAADDLTGPALIDHIEATHQALEDALNARDAQALQRAEDTAEDFSSLRRRALTTLSHLRDLALLILPTSQAEVVRSFYA
jgi:hypothetical protein